MTTSLFNSQPRITLQFSNTTGFRNLQDTPKEDYIFCELCEKRIEIIETIFARKIREIHDYNKFPNKFSHVINGQSEILRCNDIDPALFKLFIYSLIWRISISQLELYDKFTVPAKIEEVLRIFLDENLQTKHVYLKNHLFRYSTVPEFHFCLIKPKIRTFPPGGSLSAFSYDSNLHLVMLVDFALFFIVEDGAVSEPLKIYSNKQNEVVLIGLGDNSLWFEFNESLMRQMQNKV